MRGRNISHPCGGNFASAACPRDSTFVAVTTFKFGANTSLTRLVVYLHISQISQIIQDIVAFSYLYYHTLLLLLSNIQYSLVSWYKCITQICIARTSHTQTDMYHAHTLSYHIYSFLHSSESRSQHNSLSTVYSLEPSQSVLKIYWHTLVLFRIRAHMQHYYTTYTQYDVLLYLTLMQYIYSVSWNLVLGQFIQALTFRLFNFGDNSQISPANRQQSRHTQSHSSPKRETCSPTQNSQTRTLQTPRNKKITST